MDACFSFFDIALDFLLLLLDVLKRICKFLWICFYKT